VRRARFWRPAEALRSPSLRDASYVWLQVTVDGQVLPLSPRELLAAGHTNPVALIIGNNTRELTVPGGDEQIDAFLADSFGEHEAAARSVYGYRPGGPVPASDASYGSFSERLSGDIMFRCPAVRTAPIAGRGGPPGMAVPIRSHRQRAPHWAMPASCHSCSTICR
jgi:carboxylesterase type B